MDVYVTLLTASANPGCCGVLWSWLLEPLLASLTLIDSRGELYLYRAFGTRVSRGVPLRSLLLIQFLNTILSLARLIIR